VAEFSLMIIEVGGVG